MRTIDTCGQLCPAPLIAAKRALKETPEGGSFQLLIDNHTSFNNVSRFLKDNRISYRVVESDGIWTLTVSKGKGELIIPEAEEYCTDTIAHFHKGDFVIAITSDKMGEGDADLGRLLMTNFIRAIKDLDKLPRKMLFYNRGVTLVTKDSAVIDHLTDLERMGVELFLCGTCIDHYSLADKIGAGTVSNIYTIAEIMASAGNIVRP